MVVTEAKRVCDDTRIDVLCYDVYETDYGSKEKFWIYSNQCATKDEAIRNVDEWVRRIKTYAAMLKKQIEELEK